MKDPDLDWYDWVDYRDDLYSYNDQVILYPTTTMPEEATMTDYPSPHNYERTLLRECADSARYFDKCQDEAAEFQAEQDALILKRQYMVQKHAAAELRMRYAFEAYNKHLYAWKIANSFGHDYTNSDHCDNCGAEQYEGDAYYGGCTPATPTCDNCGSELCGQDGWEVCCPRARETEVSE